MTGVAFNLGVEESDFSAEVKPAGTAADLTAVERLYSQCGEQLLGFFRSRIGQEEAEDASQDLYLRIWQKECAGDLDQSRAKSYLFSSANNHAIDTYRKRSVRPTSDEECSAIPDTAPLTEEAVLWQQAGEVLAATIRDMPAVTRTVFVLHHFQGMKYQQIAVQLKLSLRTVERHMQRALETCRRRLQPYMEMASEDVSHSDDH